MVKSVFTLSGGTDNNKATASAKVGARSYNLAHYTLRFHKRGYRDFSGKCNLIQQREKTAYVAIYDIDKSEIPLLDRAEGAGAGYDRTLITVDGFGDCLIYLAASDHIDDTLTAVFLVQGIGDCRVRAAGVSCCLH